MKIDDISELKKLRDFLNKNWGIYIQDDKLNGAYRKKIKKVMQKFGFDDLKTFVKTVTVNKNSSIVQEFINTLTVNETYFFREKYQFDVLFKYILPDIDSKKDKDEVINILSAPCSTGEEIYSIAIYFLEEKELLNKRDFMLIGIDIDAEAIEKAKKGIYSERSLTKLPPYIVNKYFKKIGNKYFLKDIVKNAVNFRVVNILNKFQMKKLGLFDVIFCRNMLIYFDGESRRKVLKIFHDIMKPESYLFLGHAEKVPDDLDIFEKIKINGVYLYKKITG